MRPATSAFRSLARLRPGGATPACRPTAAAFSTRRPLRSDQRSNPHKDRESGPNPDYPPFSFEALGVSKNMKMVLIGLLSVFGTIETWFWCKAIWRWWKGDGKDEEEHK
ncbi:hypothetical protein GTA08_BOTSDO12540 [Neofusicoccum parvum]|nr:hypothetical protein GTA08_BOTSDO12540 [Neofusicoccum parvum]